MPRHFVYEDTDRTLADHIYGDGPYPPLRKTGRLEMSKEEFYGPPGCWGWLYGQFEGGFYSTAAADKVFNWVNKNAKKPWYWRESIENHGHSYVTSVYFSDKADAALFRTFWSEHLEYREHTNKLNEEALEKRQRETGVRYRSDPSE